MGATEVTLVPATPGHALELAPRLRAADLAECLAAGYPSARTALEEAVENSTEAWAVYFGAEIAVLYGVNPLAAGVTLVWLLTGEAVDRAPLSFFRSSRELLARLRREHQVLGNLVDARYQAALRWLQSLGFRIHPPVPHPKTGAPFCLATLGVA